MDLKQLEYIIKIAEENNITRAAEKLFITQSALNQQLLRLDAPETAGGPRQQLRLVIAPLAQALPAHRHPGDGVELPAEVLRRALGDQLPQRPRRGGAALELEAQQGLAHGVLIAQGGCAGHPAGEVLDDVPIRDPGEGGCTGRADAGGIQDFAAEGAFGREEEVQK